MASASEPVAEILAATQSRPATLGPSRLVCIDGPSGAGKTELAARLVARHACPVVHLDDLYAGWDGLWSVHETLTGLLRPLAAGHPGHYRRYDWHAGGFAETVTVFPAPLLVVEGVGAGHQSIADLITVLVWVDAPEEMRHRRALERDGEQHRGDLERWWRAETAHYAADRTRERADVIVLPAAP